MKADRTKRATLCSIMFVSFFSRVSAKKLFERLAREESTNGARDGVWEALSGGWLSGVG